MQPTGNDPKLSVLVIDQDRRTADSLAFALDISGFSAKAVYTGQQAMELAAMQPFHFVVSDALAETKGVKALLAICEVSPDCKVLLMSSNGDSLKFIEEARANGYLFDFLAKPSHPGLLVEKLREYTSGCNQQTSKSRDDLLRLRKQSASTPEVINRQEKCLIRYKRSSQ